MRWFSDVLVSKDSDIITIHSLQNANAVDDFIKQIRKGHLKEGYEQLTINFDKSIQGVFPNAAVPIAGIIDFFRQEKKLQIDGKSYDVNLQNILIPYELPLHKTSLDRALGKIWKFSLNNS